MRHVALLRGVNVGGGNKLPMADLRAQAADLGWQDITTYIASGNLVFRASGTPDDLATALRAKLAVDVPVLVLTGDDLRAAVLGCPFPPDPGNLVHGFFCFDPPAMDEARAASLQAPTEALAVMDRIVWLHAPEGIGRSKLVEKMDKVITGTTFTARNFNTIRKLAALAAD